MSKKIRALAVQKARFVCETGLNEHEFSCRRVATQTPTPDDVAAQTNRVSRPSDPTETHFEFSTLDQSSPPRFSTT